MGNRWDLWDVLRLPYGRQRREMLVAYLESGMRELYVNRRYCVQIKEYPDLRYMLKNGILRRVRIKGSWNSSCTKLVLNKE